MKYFKRTDGGYSQVDETTNPTDYKDYKKAYKEVTKSEYNKATYISEPVYNPTYSDIVVQKIRSKYSIDDELAIQRQKDVKPDEFKTYNDFCEQCKKEAQFEIHGKINNTYTEPLYPNSQDDPGLQGPKGIEPKPQPTEQELNDMINAKISAKYPIERQLDIIQCRYSNPEQYAEFNEFCEQCEIEVKSQYN